jgi:hypothetical protein
MKMSEFCLLPLRFLIKQVVAATIAYPRAEVAFAIISFPA